MWGLGELCSQSGALDAPNNNGTGDPLGQHAGIFYRNSATKIAAITDGTSNTIMVGERSHNLSYVTWVARSIDGWLGKTSPIEGGTDKFNPSPEECWTQIMGPVRLGGWPSHDQQPRGARRGLLEPAPRRSSTCSSPTARCTSSSRRSARCPGGHWRPGDTVRSSRPTLTDPISCTFGQRPELIVTACDGPECRRPRPRPRATRSRAREPAGPSIPGRPDVVVGLVKFDDSRAWAAAALNDAVGLTIMAKFAFRASM